MEKEPFDIDEVFRRLRRAVKPFPKAAMFELRDQGFDSPFEQLVACIVSIRTRDETTVPVARRLFERARTAAVMARLSAAEIEEAIHACTFHGPKSRQIHDIAMQVVDRWDGELPCDFEALTALRGVGPKCANLTLGVACDQPRIAVDIHVHRITNRWGYVSAKTPEATLIALEAKLPKKYRVEINERLVPFGKHTCTGKLPHCHECPLLSMCRQVGVRSHR